MKMKKETIMLVVIVALVLAALPFISVKHLEIVAFSPNTHIYSYGTDDIATVEGFFDRVEILIPEIDYSDAIFYAYAYPDIWIHTTERYDLTTSITVNFQEQTGINNLGNFIYETFDTQTFESKIEPSVSEGIDVIDVLGHSEMNNVMLTKHNFVYQDCWIGGKWMTLHVRSNSEARQFIAPSVKSYFTQAEGWQLNPPAEMDDSKGFGTIPANYDNAACEIYVYFRFFVNTMPTSDTITCYIDCDYDSGVCWGDPDSRGFDTMSFTFDVSFYENPDPPPKQHSLAVWSYWEDERIDDIVQVWVDEMPDPLLTPASVSLVCNEPHTLTAKKYIQVGDTELEFKHWKTTPETMKHSRTITVTFGDIGSSLFRLVYGPQESIDPPPKYKLTITATPVQSLVWLDGTLLGSTTQELDVYEGEEHTVQVQKEVVVSESEKYVFEEWEDQTTVENRTVSLGSDAELVAHYKRVPTHEEGLIEDSHDFFSVPYFSDPSYESLPSEYFLIPLVLLVIAILIYKKRKSEQK